VCEVLEIENWINLELKARIKAVTYKANHTWKPEPRLPYKLRDMTDIMQRYKDVTSEVRA
jgi:hypothetical protein